MFSGDELKRALLRGPSFHSATTSSQDPAIQERATLLQDLSEISGISSHSAWQAELRALATETDPSYFDQGLLALATRMEALDRMDLAVRVWQGIQSLNNPSEALALAARSLARARGEGGFGSRAEILLTKFCRDTLDPATLAGFAVGGLAYRYGKLFAGARLFSELPGSGLLPGWGLRGLAASFGFAMEVPSFVLGERTVGGLLGRPEGFDSNSLPQELASVALMLGPMKVFTAASHSLAQRWALTSGLSSEVLQQGGALAGILMGHRLERAVGLKPVQEVGSEWLEAFTTLIQARAAGGLVEAYSGTRGRMREAEWELRWQNAANRNAGSEDSFRDGDGQLAWAGASPTSLTKPLQSDFGREAPQILLSQMQGTGASGSRKIIGFDRGALAWGGESALNWLLDLRKTFEEKFPEVPVSEFQLWWIPESPVDHVLLNDHDVAFRREARRFDRVNLPARIPIRALGPLPRPGEIFVHSVEFSDGLGKLLKRWTERDHDGLRDLINAEWLELQFLTLCRAKTGFVEKIHENGRDYLLFEEGKRQLHPPNLTMYPQAQDPHWQRARAAISHFQNQYWIPTPTEAALIFGKDLGARLPEGVVINYFLHPQVLMLPTWGVEQGMGEKPQFFFIQGTKSWMARIGGGILQDVTASVPEERLDFLRNISILGPRVVAEEKSGESISQPVPASGQEAATERYPSENYPDRLFVDQTVPYTSLYPPSNTVAGETAPATTERLALQATQPLVIADSAASRSDPRLPYDDTALMGPEDIAQVRALAKRPPPQRWRRAWEDMRVQARKAWINTQFLWHGIKLGFYQWTGRQAPPALILKVQELRRLIQGKGGGA